MSEVVTSLQLSNEFATVAVRCVRTDRGERLVIEAPKRGTRIELDPVELEALTWCTHDALSQLLVDQPVDASH
jgi:hypothetical protein